MTMETRTRLVMIAEDALEQFGARTDDGRKLTFAWEPVGKDGFSKFTVTAIDDGKAVVDRHEVEQMAMAVMRPGGSAHV